MSLITIQCNLVAKEETRQQLWQLMAERNTPLVNELLTQVTQHSDFIIWKQKGKLPNTVVDGICKTLKSDVRFMGQPARFVASALKIAKYTIKSWLALQKRTQQKLDGKICWLKVLKSDDELVELSRKPITDIHHQANKILLRFGDAVKRDSIFKTLLQQFKDSEDSPNSWAIAYLLKNGCKLPLELEDADKFAKRRRKVEIQIERLTEQLEAQLPKGRDLTGQKWLDTLAVATTTMPESEIEAHRWQSELLKKSSNVPFPLIFETNEDLSWFRNAKSRLCVRFPGLREHDFEIYCDQRQLHWFTRFLEDQEVKRQRKDQHSSSLFTLRSVRLSWLEGNGNGKPWHVARLALYCTVDTRLWTTEGTEQVRQEKVTEILKVIDHAKTKSSLTKTQQSFVKRKESTLAKINNPFPRPSQQLYVGRSNILVGVSIGLQAPATIAVVDGVTGKALSYRSAKQLLGDRYNLLNRHRYQQRQNVHRRRNAQKRFNSNQFETTDLGQYLDRLLAQAIVKVAQEYHAGSIVVPKLENLREVIQSEIQTKAEQKLPGFVELQKQYAKQYRMNIHVWSYNRLIQSIQSQALQANLCLEECVLDKQGNSQEKAKALAIAAYKARC